MKRMTLAAALIALAGTTALVAPHFATAQDAATAPAEAQTDTSGAGMGMGMGMGMRGHGDMGMGMGMGPAGLMSDFAAMDANKDGSVSQDEMKAWRASQISGLDADKDGKVSEAELTAFIQKKLDARAAEMAKARIAAQDVDGDGALSAAELMAPPMPEKMFARLDTNGDGAVSQDEVSAAQARMQQRMDGQQGGKGGWRMFRHGRHQGGGDGMGFGDNSGN